MRLMTLRAAILRPAALQRTVVLLGVVIAIVLGLIAMHTIASGMGGHSEPAATVMTVDADHQMSGTQPDSAPCPGDCAPVPGRDMTAMVCVLALMVGGTLLLVGLLRSAQQRDLGPQIRLLVSAVRSVRCGPYRDPPDLIKLSISRT
jgi:hypothetical protein